MPPRSRMREHWWPHLTPAEREELTALEAEITHTRRALRRLTDHRLLLANRARSRRTYRAKVLGSPESFILP